MTMAEAMLRLAQRIADAGARSASARRRAASTAYYGVFRAIADLCTEEFARTEDKKSLEYERIYRSLDHSPLKNAFGQPPLRTAGR